MLKWGQYFGFVDYRQWWSISSYGIASIKVVEVEKTGIPIISVLTSLAPLGARQSSI